MKSDQRSKKFKKMKIENSNEWRTMPLAVGDILVFNADADNFIEEVPENGDFRPWTRINAVNGAISATQLLRSGNGLKLQGDDNTARIQYLVDNYSDGDMVFSILIADEKVRGAGANERRYFKLRIVAGEAHSAEDFA